MKNIVTFLLLIVTLIGCKKGKVDDRPKDTYHVSITSSHEDFKFLYFGNEKRPGFEGKTFDTDFQVVKGQKVQVWTGFEFNNPKPDHLINVIVTIGSKVLENKTQKEHVSIAVDAP